MNRIRYELRITSVFNNAEDTYYERCRSWFDANRKKAIYEKDSNCSSVEIVPVIY